MFLRQIVSSCCIVICLFILSTVCAAHVPAVCNNIEPGYYLFSYFKGNGEDGIHLAFSLDAKHFYAFNQGQSIFPSDATIGQGIIRDPVSARAPDGTYHIVWSTGWTSPVIGYASTRDFIHWTNQGEHKQQRAITLYPQLDQAKVNVWAPSLFFDEVKNQFIILWAYFEPGQDKRLHYSTTTDFSEVSDAYPYFNPGYTVIDGVLVDAGLEAGHKYVIIYKDERAVEKHLDVARLPALYPAVGGIFHAKTPGIELQGIERAIAMNEGPTVLKVALQSTAAPAWIVYYDHYFSANGPLQHYGAYLTTDFKRFDKVTSCLRFPDHPRHGGVVKTDCKIINALWDRYPPERAADLPPRPVCG
ncbi:MAG: hypothetical protein A3J38_01225 [Gammaproteobacteria bacterium RIFCSPHIGHO2_12_FULL_45_9]|nr:MAG: hypothetical protein A3J38_01225 [Gammaproteobacteria bacterium RIFCSPHIGHO2_12_FULL_45_9]